MATTQETLQISAIVPSFTVDDLRKSITFYEALGFMVDSATICNPRADRSRFQTISQCGLSRLD